MRLSKIRIAGFKSFVDPVTLDLRSNLVGILGPNGCGKSNTIDAVRWVMGESSAKHLRGQSMDDVIFNGSSARKPVGQASVELVFDNSDGQLGGEYAQYAEISVKRLVSRDGSSKYFLNGSRCRRRDITDIFLGTGLGPRSYAIIEQGMISRLIEAKPEELRNTLEEAAGISRYKDRRRETETRISQTRENLERLTDLRDELGQQLQKLDRQAKAAEKFKILRHQERELEAKQLLLQEQGLQQQHDQLVTQLSAKSTAYQAQLAEVRQLEAQIEQLRATYAEANDQLNEIQGEYYQAGAEISRIEQTIRHQQDIRDRQQKSLQQLQQSLDETLQHAEEDRETLQLSQQRLAELEPESERIQRALEQAEERLYEAEEQLQDWQEQWQELQQRLAEPSRQAQIEKNHMEQTERLLSQLEQRQQKLASDAANLSTEQFVSDIRQLEAKLSQLQQAYALAEARLAEHSEQLEQSQLRQQQQQQELNNKRARWQTQQGRLSALKTLQDSSSDKANSARKRWLEQHGYAQNPRLTEQLTVSTGWEAALETVLADSLDSVCVDSLPLSALDGSDLTETGVSLLAANTEHADDIDLAGADPAQTLAAKVLTPTTARQWLHGILCADDLASAMKLQANLQPGQSVITRDGIWLGPDWLRLPGKNPVQHNRLQRQQEIRELSAECEQLQPHITELETSLQQLQSNSKDLEQQRRQAQQETNQLHRDESSCRSELSALQQRIDQLHQRQQQISLDQQDVAEQIAARLLEHEQATEQRNIALLQLEALEVERDQLADEKDERQFAQSNARSQVRELQEQRHSLQLELETQRNRLDNSQRQLERVNSRLQQLEEQRTELLAQIADQDDPQEILAAELEEALESRAEVEVRLSEARQQVQTLEHGVREQDGLRVSAERQAETLRDQQEQLKLDWQGIHVRLETLSEQFNQTEFDRDSLRTSLTTLDTLPAINEQLDKLQRDIQRLGAINLAAIDEYKEQSERKVWLDQQNDDLVQALATLETAIQKIDKETRSRFRETFDHVNGRLKAMFPRLFGGGECYLHMTDNDLLTTGIAIMARPPGKRISSIHLMSGGEKALTAVALVFAIFELNPAPFCMLDEVDAPLDEANVGRFCDLVQHMAERVQFIFITHNKRTMELADNLIGVTMREPGVSRLVAVDIASAVRMVEQP